MIFVDTSGLYAVMDRTNEQHERAAAIWHQLISENTALVMTNYIALESLTLVQSRLGFEAARQLLKAVFPVIDQGMVDETLHQVAMETLLSQGKRHLSLVDCVSFAYMRRLRISKAFSFDRHFVDAGFTLITKSGADTTG